MATLLKADGTSATVTPAGKKWTLAELQQHVGGFIEMPPWLAPLRMVWNEDGANLGLPVNVAATERIRARLAEIGKPLRYVPTLRGDVLVLDPKEKA